MRFIFGILMISLMILQLFGCSEQSGENQLADLSENEKVAFRKEMIRYIGKKPEDASDENKFDAYFDGHYTTEEQAHQLERYIKSKDGKVYFLFTRTAPSLTVKRVAIGGYVEFDKNGDVVVLEEVFRTWKMSPEKLSEVSSMLFSKMLDGEDLKPYYTENSGGVEYIEFPNAEVWYDKDKRKWMTSRINPLEEFQEAKIKNTQAKIDSLNNSR
jgi:hypothetical protein